ncbi:MAG: rod shape-determining protein RodA [Acidimicrobiales bacterium]
MAAPLTGHEFTVGRRERHPLLVVLRHVDYPLVASAFALGLLGVLMVYSATRTEYGDYYAERQAVWMLLGVVIMAVVMMIDYSRFREYGYPIYGLIVLSLAGVFVVGKRALGAERWYQLGALQLQPSEFAAIGLIIAFATYCSHRKGVLELREFLALLLLAIVPLLLVYKQPDLGTTIIMTVTLAAMLLAAGVRVRYLAVLGVLAIGAVLAVVHLHLLDQYQLQRITSFLHQSKNQQGSNYDLTQSKESISAGGFRGTGLFNGLATNLGFIPNQVDDFIFSAVGEQLGFVGAAVMIGLFGVMTFRCLRAAQTARDPFGRLVCAGALAFVAFSVFENVGMTIGIMPITGIPLPFISYGGSASFAFFATVGLVANVEMRRQVHR